MGKRNLKKGLRDLEKVEGRSGADTIRLWDGYRDQALLWRAMSLLQMPITLTALIFAIVMYVSADTIIQVPSRPLPGNYSVKQLPDAEFINVATEVINLTTTYSPKTARKQFVTTQKFLWEPALTKFEEVMLGDELRAIEETGRSQIFMVDEDLIRVERFPGVDQVEVRLPGRRVKMIGNRPILEDELVFKLKMTTIPRNVHNEHGIVIIDIRMERMDLRALADMDAGVKVRSRDPSRK